MDIKIDVPGVGPSSATIAFVGEAPGEDEQRAHEPFVGKSGKLLTALMHSAGIIRQDCYITNVIKTRPPGNDIKKYIHINDKHIVVSTSPEYLAYVDLLKKELDEVRPNVVVAVGNIALYALTGHIGVLNYRGSILSYQTPSGRTQKVIPIIHPAGALRTFVWRRYIGYDLLRVRKDATTPDLNLPKRNILIRPTLTEALEYLEDCNHADAISYDIETLKNHVACIGFSADPSTAMCIPLIEHNNDFYSFDDELTIWCKIAEVLQNPEVRKVTQNGCAFDAPFLYRHFGIRTTSIDDIRVMHSILYPDLPASLAFMGANYTREPYFKDEGSEVKGGRIKDFERLWYYNSKDCCVTLEVYEVLLQLLERQQNMDTYRKQIAIAPILQYMQERGILVEVERLKPAKAEVYREIEELTKELATTMIIPMPDKFATSPKKQMDYFYSTLGHKPYVKREKGSSKPTIDEKALIRLARKGVKEAAILGKIRKKQKLVGTYYEMKVEEDDRLRCNFSLITKNGRLSSSQTLWGTGGNLQNLDKRFKSFLSADPEYMLVEMDLSQAENRIVAYIAPEPRLIEAYETNQDVYRLTFGLIFGIPPEDVSNEPGSSTIGDGSRSQRAWGKEVKLALNYGIGVPKLAMRLEIAETEARILHTGHNRAYPGIVAWHRKVEQQLQSDGRFTNAYGRKRVFLGHWSDNLEKAYNFEPQSTVGDKMHRDGLGFIWGNRHRLPGVEVLDQIHDSILFQLPITLGWSTITSHLTTIKTQLETPIPYKTPITIPVETKIGRYWGKMVELRDYLPKTLEQTWSEMDG